MKKQKGYDYNFSIKDAEAIFRQLDAEEDENINEEVDTKDSNKEEK